MAFMYLFLFLTVLFSKSHSNELFPNVCLEGKILNNHCKCETFPQSERILLPELQTDAEAKMSCSGNQALQAAIDTIEMLKGNLVVIELHISNSSIDKILYRDLKHFPHLRYLSITSSFVTNIENEAFKEQKFLESLDLSRNQINDLKSYMFEPLVNLKNLSISDNQLYVIDPKAFHNMPTLSHLDLSGNNLKSVNGNWFAAFKNLETLSLKDNNIKSLEANSFHHLLHLHKLDLSFNSLREISPPTFFRLKNLKYVSLAMNEFESLNESSFKGNSMLEKVNLTGNLWNCDRKLLLLNDWLKKYEVDKEGAFCMNPPGFQNFTIQHGLEIVYMEIKVQESPICNVSMCNCTIARDKLVISVDCTARGFTRLPETVPYKTKVLNLCNNNIKSLTIDHIDSTMWADVSFLHLNNNVIDSLKGLEGTWLLRNLVALHLSNNQLTEIPIHILEQFRGGLLDELYLSGNPWNCDCNTVRFQTWLQDNYKAVREFDGIRCSSSSGAYSNQPIYRLQRSQLCPQQVQLVNYLDILNGLMAVAIVLIVIKLTYDYQLQKRTGKLPRFFSLNFA